MAGFFSAYLFSQILSRIVIKKGGKNLNIQNKEIKISEKHKKRIFSSALSVKHILATGGELF